MRRLPNFRFRNSRLHYLLYGLVDRLLAILFYGFVAALAVGLSLALLLAFGGLDQLW